LSLNISTDSLSVSNIPSMLFLMPETTKI
jgi:hypothetical protein